MQRTWHVDWRHGKASGPVPESDLTKTVADYDDDSSDESDSAAAPAYDPDEHDSSSSQSHSDASDVEPLGPPPTPDINALSKRKAPPPKPIHGTPPPLPRGGPLGAKSLAHESDDELLPPPTPGKPTAKKAANRDDDDSSAGEPEGPDVDDAGESEDQDVDEVIARLEKQKLAAAEAEDFATAAALKKQVRSLADLVVAESFTTSSRTSALSLSFFSQIPNP